MFASGGLSVKSPGVGMAFGINTLARSAQVQSQLAHQGIGRLAHERSLENEGFLMLAARCER